MLFVAAWFAFPSWANDLPGQPRPEATASDWASALRASTLAQASRERSIQAELRRGLDRLTKSCVATGPPSVANPQPLKADLLEQELGDLDRLLNPLSERTNRLLGQAERRREQMCPALPLIPKSAACRIAEDRRDSLKQLSAALPAQRSDLLSRYNLYAEAGRLESKGWVRREADEQDRRRKRLWITEAGQAVAQQIKRPASHTQERLVAPLSQLEQAQLVELLAKLVAAHEAPPVIGSS